MIQNAVLFGAGWGQGLLGLLMFLASLFLILLVLVQRGRGGGLAGAFGGMGGQSAFGTKAGDTFTRITIVAASVWILLCMVSVKLLSTSEAEDSLLNTEVPGIGESLSEDLGSSVGDPAVGVGDATTLDSAGDAAGEAAPVEPPVGDASSSSSAEAGDAGSPSVGETPPQ